MSETSAELIVEAKAHLDGQDITNPDFYAAVERNLSEIDLKQLKPCSACESALCGQCGRCHDLDHEFLFVGPICPAAVATLEYPECTAWNWAYWFLRRGEKVLRRKQSEK